MQKKPLIYTAQAPKYDIFKTPPHAVLPLLKYIPQSVKIVWECCDPEWSVISKILRDKGYTVISTDITTGFDFLNDKPTFDFDMIITNPPYSQKDKFITKCYNYGKSFALLLPITALEGVNRQSYYRKYGINIVLFDKRIDFMKKQDKKTGAWFAVAWFIYYHNQANNKIYYERISNLKS